MSDTDRSNQSELLEDTREKLRHPRRYTVVLHNDDYTTQEFVVYVLTEVFHLSSTEAFEIMMHVHKKGAGRVGDYSYDVARTKAARVRDLARQHEYPLQCSVEPLTGDEQ